MRLLRAVIFTLALAVGLTLAPAAEARHVFVSYVDAGRPSTFAKADVMAAIQRVLREWEAHVSISSFVFHWQGEIPLAGAPENYDNVVIRWGGVCPGLLGASCRASPSIFCGGPDCPISLATNHIVLFSNVTQGQVVNNPRFVPPGDTSFDLTSTLTHELAHLFLDDDETQHSVWGTSVLNILPGMQDRSLWNYDILNVNISRYPGHYQALQTFSINPSNGAMSVLRHYQPTYRVLSPASIATGDGVGATGGYLVAYGSRTPAGSSGPRNAIVMKFTDGRVNDVDVIYQGSLGGQSVGTTYHRPCVAVATNQSYYLVWASPIEDPQTGARQVLFAESHAPGAAGLSAPAAIPGALTRAGISCAVDPRNNRLVVAYSNAADERIMLTHRNAWSTGASWTAPAAVTTTVAGAAASSLGPPDLAFNFFDTSGLGTLSWQDNADLRVHTAQVSLVSGAYTVSSAGTHNVDVTMLRSWPVLSPEINRILGSSLFVLPGSTNRREERRAVVGTVLDADAPYAVGAVHASRRYTGAASHRLLMEQAFLSTANTGW